MSTLAKLKETNVDASQWRQHLHQNPETAFEEVKTADYVADLLGSWGVEIHRGLAKTGIVATIKGKTNKSGRAIGLRADMDALNIFEETNVAYKSKNVGKMHACGHDGHTTMLLAAVRHLAMTRDFDGTVYAIFQPAEEFGGGGNVMVEEGFFEKFPCESVYGMHNWPWSPVGTMAVCEGPVSAFCDDFVITVKGVGGHAAFPQTTVDVVATTAAIVTALQSVVSRNVAPADAGVVSVCKFQAGTEALNVLPESAVIGGTARCLKPEVRKLLETGVKRVAASVAAAYGATVDIDWRYGYPATVNTSKETQAARDAAAAIVGAGNVQEFSPMLGGEDFAYFLEKKPGCYIVIGQLDEGKEPIGLHNPRYDFNDKIIPIGAAYWVQLAESLLAAK